MHFSATSYMMAILGGTCLICFLCIIMKNNRITGTLSIRFLKYFSIFILIRMMLPFEFFHTITIPSMKILPAIIDFCNEHVLFSFGNTAVTLSRLLLFIWIAGIICIAFNTFRNYLILYGIIRSLPDITDAPDNPVSAVLTEIYEKNPVPHPVKKVLRTKYVGTPCIIGFFSPVIFLPDIDFTQEELYCILYHELSHLRHRDLIWMVFTEFLCIVNWWNPFISLLRVQITKISELHADNTTCAGLSPMQCSLYMECLLKVARSQRNKLSMPAISLPFSDTTCSFLKYRFLRIIEPKQNKPFAKFMLNGIAILLLVLSTMFIVEPSWMPEGVGNDYFIITEDSYLLERTDGTYEFYIDDEHFMGIISDNELEEIEGLPIYSTNSKTPMQAYGTSSK